MSSRFDRKTEYHDTDPVEALKKAIPHDQLLQIYNFCQRIRVSDIRSVLSQAGVKSFGGKNLSRYRKEELCSFISKAVGKDERSYVSVSNDIDLHLNECEKYKLYELEDYIVSKGWTLPPKKRRTKPELCRLIRMRNGSSGSNGTAVNIANNYLNYTDKDLEFLIETDDRRLTIGVLMDIAKHRRWNPSVRSKQGLLDYFSFKLGLIKK